MKIIESDFYPCCLSDSILLKVIIVNNVFIYVCLLITLYISMLILTCKSNELPQQCKGENETLELLCHYKVLTLPVKQPGVI